ncbi:MAG: phosphoadenosine phosphosulfate reductase family protein, partial [Salinimicrobium sp.]
MAVLTEKRNISAAEVAVLNNKYKDLSITGRIAELYKDFNQAEIMLTSSFAATSAFLLKFFSEVNQDQLVYFIDTGYHFEETLEYKQKLTELYGLKVKSISAVKEEHEFTIHDQTWKKNPDLCCQINKVKPIDLIKAKYTLWV